MHAGNVWLHFAPSIFLAGKLVWWLFHMDVPHAGAHLRAVASILACLLLSSGYHLFMAQVKHYYRWLKIDVRSHFLNWNLWLEALVHTPRNVKEVMVMSVLLFPHVMGCGPDLQDFPFIVCSTKFQALKHPHSFYA
jgi:hypothetical protein